MKKEHDFSNAERGKFYKPDATFNIPIYLDAEVISYLQERAQSKGVGLSQLINDILRKDIALIEAVK